MLSTRLSARRRDWFGDALESVRRDGYAIVEDVLAPALLERTREAMYRVRKSIRADIGPERLARAEELGVLRLMLRYDSHFYALLELEDVLAVVDASLSSSAILHLQNGLILPPRSERCASKHFPPAFHQDFPRYLDGYVASITMSLALDDLDPANGAMRLVPGSHQRPHAPGIAELEATAVPARCPAGSMVIFDSTLWHAAGVNRSDGDCLLIDQQFTRAFVTPQVDYVRALGDEIVLRHQPRTQQLLGWYTRAVASLDELYTPADQCVH